MDHCVIVSRAAPPLDAPIKIVTGYDFGPWVRAVITVDGVNEAYEVVRDGPVPTAGYARPGLSGRLKMVVGCNDNDRWRVEF